MDVTQLAIHVFEKNALQYQQKFMNVDLYKESLDLFCRSISNDAAHILDVACGPGNVTKYILTKRPDFKILGIDLSQAMLTLAMQNNPSADFNVMNGKNISDLKAQFDGIICSFGLPYFSKEEAVQFIRDTTSLLRIGGVLYISTMEGEYCTSRMETSSQGDQLYTYYHQADYLLNALNGNGFIIIDVQHKQYPADTNIITDLIIVAKSLRGQ